MGHYCRICGRERPHEQFSGKGHKTHVCKRCISRPKSERQAIEDKDDIFAFLEQSHISEKNVMHLERMAKSDNPQVASFAAIVLDVARVKPYKTRRLKFLAQKHPGIAGEVAEHGFDSGLANGKKKNPQTAVSHSCAHELSVRSRFGSGDLEPTTDLVLQYGLRRNAQDIHK